MKRNIDKAVKEYDKYISKHPKCDLHMSEMTAIIDKAFSSRGGMDGTISSMVLGYKQGFMVGYRAALRDMKKKEGLKHGKSN